MKSIQSPRQPRLPTIACAFVAVLIFFPLAGPAMAGINRETVTINGFEADAETVLAKFSTDPDALSVNSSNPKIARIAARIRQVKFFRTIRRLAVIHLARESGGNRAERLAARIKELKDTGLFAYVEPDYIVRANVTPSDAAFTDGRLWGLQNTGQKGGTSGADIEAVEAWNQTTGSANVIVGIIDSGIRYTHQDLEANTWENPDEIPNNGIDDDDNGYIDDMHGINAITGSGDPMDDNDHGSHCAGTIGATANGSGPHVGVAWDVSLMGLKFLSSKGSGRNSNAIECIDYAISKGVDILNNSWGGGGYSQALFDAISRAKDAGILFVVAASNEGTNNDSKVRYPSGFAVANIVSVAAIDRKDQLASFSNYGATSVHLAAPGVSIYSCTAESDSSYDTYDGTSMAAPHVSGVAALVKAKYPALTMAELKNRIINNTRPLSSLSGRTISGGTVSAKRALANSGGSTPPPISSGNTFAASGLPKSIPDRSTITSTITVSGQPGSLRLNTVNLQLDVSHTYVGDLLITLQPPSGRSITLWNRAGKSQNSIVIDQAISSKRKVRPNGQWKITIKDKASNDIGTLNSWSLTFPN